MTELEQKKNTEKSVKQSVEKKPEVGASFEPSEKAKEMQEKIGDLAKELNKKFGTNITTAELKNVLEGDTEKFIADASNPEVKRLLAETGGNIEAALRRLRGESA